MESYRTYKIRRLISEVAYRYCGRKISSDKKNPFRTPTAIGNAAQYKFVNSDPPFHVYPSLPRSHAPLKMSPSDRPSNPAHCMHRRPLSPRSPPSANRGRNRAFLEPPHHFPSPPPHLGAQSRLAYLREGEKEQMGDFGLWRSVYPSTQAAKAVYHHRQRHRPDPPYLFSLCQCGRPQAPFSPHPAAAEYY